MAFVVGFAIIKIKNEYWKIALVGLIIIESIANQQHDFFVNKSETYKLSLEAIATKVSLPTDLIAINGDKNPQHIYFAHRKGWTIANSKVDDPVFIDSIVSLGCKYLFLDKHLLYSIKMSSHKNRDIVFENEDFVVFSLKN